MMTVSRLSSLDADLARTLEGQPSGQLRKAASAAALLAVNGTRLADSRLDAALAAVRDGALGGSAECSAADHVTEELDEIAWDIKDKADEGMLPQEAYGEAFGRARAAAAVRFALEPHPLEAALEAIYEAQAALGDLEAIRTAVNDVLTD
jgi:hypothetical protein